MLDAILESAKSEKIDLANLLHNMRHEAGINPQTRQLGDETRHRLFSSGRLDGIANN